jgi:membrane protein DedA with SNARE-associated domain
VSELLSHLVAAASQNVPLAFFIIYLGTIFVGNISAFVSFWIILNGNFGSWGIPLLILTIFLADMTGDLSWYSLGRATHDTRFGHWIRGHVPGYKRAEATIEKNGGMLIFFAKFIYASSFPVIFSLGWTKMPFKRFLRNSVLSILIWLPILIGLAFGLIYGLSPLGALAIFKDLEWVFLIGLILFIVFDYWLARVIGRLFERRRRARTLDIDV